MARKTFSTKELTARAVTGIRALETVTTGEALALADLVLDEDIQARAKISETTVKDYAARMLAGDIFPPIDVFFDDEQNWVADGFHRALAAELAGETQIMAVVNAGDKRDAILYAVGANTDHGLQRTRADKRRAVLTLLLDPEWATWSDREIGRLCQVDGKTVAAVRKTTAEIPQSRIGRDGKVRDVSDIGAKRRPKSTVRRWIKDWVMNKEPDDFDTATPEEKAETRRQIEVAISRLQDVWDSLE